jgi:hypothetical protein
VGERDHTLQPRRLAGQPRHGSAVAQFNGRPRGNSHPPKPLPQFAYILPQEALLHSSVSAAFVPSRSWGSLPASQRVSLPVYVADRQETSVPTRPRTGAPVQRRLSHRADLRHKRPLGSRSRDSQSSLHLSKATIAPFHCVGSRGQQLVIQKGKSMAVSTENGALSTGNTRVWLTADHDWSFVALSLYFRAAFPRPNVERSRCAEWLIGHGP